MLGPHGNRTNSSVAKNPLVLHKQSDLLCGNQSKSKRTTCLPFFAFFSNQPARDLPKNAFFRFALRKISTSFYLEIIFLTNGRQPYYYYYQQVTKVASVKFNKLAPRKLDLIVEKRYDTIWIWLMVDACSPEFEYSIWIFRGAQ